MQLLLIVLSLLVLALLSYSLYDRKRTWEEMKRVRSEDKTPLLLQQQIEGAAKLLQQQMSSMTEQVGNRLDSTGRLVGDLKLGLGKLEQSAKQMLDVGKEVASLQDIFRAPKMRGGFGEFLLGDLLGQILMPESFQLQYTFKSGERVDAVVRLGKGLVPIDAKFPLENFKKITAAEDEEKRKKHRKEFANDVKRHVDAIHKKYILPDEGTFDFALMYIPAENVYYETIIKDEELGDEKSLNSYALAKRVMPVSPNSLYAYLQAIVLGLRGIRIEQNISDVLGNLKRLSKEFDKFSDDFRKIGVHLKNADKCFESADKRMARFTDRLDTIASVEDKQGTERQLTAGDQDDRG
jgi:DNA recombination protein RmuC